MHTDTNTKVNVNETTDIKISLADVTQAEQRPGSEQHVDSLQLQIYTDCSLLVVHFQALLQPDVVTAGVANHMC